MVAFLPLLSGARDADTDRVGHILSQVPVMESYHIPGTWYGRADKTFDFPAPQIKISI